MSTHKKTFIDTAQYTCMRKDTTRSPDDLLRDEGNSLQDNYALHDVGEKYLVDAIYARDFPVVQGGILFFAISFVFVNLLVDISYAAIDPRIEYN